DLHSLRPQRKRVDQTLRRRIQAAELKPTRVADLSGDLLQDALAEDTHQLSSLWTWGLEEHVFVERGVFDLLVFERHPDLAPVAALALQVGVTKVDFQLVQKRPVLDQGAQLAVPFRQTEPGELDLPVLEAPRARERNVLGPGVQP